MTTGDARLAEIVDDAAEFIRRDVEAGFLATERELLESIVLMYERQASPERLREALAPVVAEALAAHRARQATWPLVTDCDRLDAAFAELETAGILARHKYSCCGSCGAAEIRAEMEELIAQGVAVRGYTFYDDQDTESAVDGGGICLSYGSAGENAEDDQAIAIGHEVAATLTRHGLTVAWNGAIERRIDVSLDWQRRGPPAGG